MNFDQCIHGKRKVAKSQYATDCEDCQALLRSVRTCPHGHRLQKRNVTGFSTNCHGCDAILRRIGKATKPVRRCNHGVVVVRRDATRAAKCLACKREATAEQRKAGRMRRDPVALKRHNRRLCQCGHMTASHEVMRDGTRGPCEASLGGYGFNERICPCAAFTRLSDEARTRHAA